MLPAQTLIQAWDEENRPDFAQNMAHVWAFEALRHSPLRTYDVRRASLVVLPLETALSSKIAKPCGGLATHAQRLQRLTASVERWLSDHNPAMPTQAQGTTSSSGSSSWGSWGGRSSAPSGRRLLSNNKKKNSKKGDSKRGGSSSSAGSSAGGSGNAALDYRGPPVMVFGTYWATFRDWGGRAMRKHEMEPSGSSAETGGGGGSEQNNATFSGSRRHLLQQRQLASWNSDASSDATSSDTPKQRKPPTLWQLLASHGILVTIDEYFSHDWGKVLVAPYLAHSDVTKQLLPAGSSPKDMGGTMGGDNGGRTAGGGFLATKAANGAEYRDGRTLQLYFRGGVDHGSMCKRLRPVSSSFASEDSAPGGSGISSSQDGGGGDKNNKNLPRKRSAAELRDAANRGADATTTWLREAAVQFFANAPPGVQFDGGGDRAKVYTRRRRLEAANSISAHQQQQKEEGPEQQLLWRFSERQEYVSSNETTIDASNVTTWLRQQEQLDHQQRRLASSSKSHPAAHPPSSYARAEYVDALLNSRFCLHLQGDTTTSRRLFDAIAAGCIPVIIADGVNLPFSSQV
jgi:hypothetical protein